MGPRRQARNSLRGVASVKIPGRARFLRPPQFPQCVFLHPNWETQGGAGASETQEAPEVKEGPAPPSGGNRAARRRCLYARASDLAAGDPGSRVGVNLQRAKSGCACCLPLPKGSAESTAENLGHISTSRRPSDSPWPPLHIMRSTDSQKKASPRTSSSDEHSQNAFPSKRDAARKWLKRPRLPPRSSPLEILTPRAKR